MKFLLGYCRQIRQIPFLAGSDVSFQESQLIPTARTKAKICHQGGRSILTQVKVPGFLASGNWGSVITKPSERFVSQYPSQCATACICSMCFTFMYSQYNPGPCIVTIIFACMVIRYQNLHLDTHSDVCYANCPSQAVFIVSACFGQILICVSQTLT